MNRPTRRTVLRATAVLPLVGAGSCSPAPRSFSAPRQAQISGLGVAPTGDTIAFSVRGRLTTPDRVPVSVIGLYRRRDGSVSRIPNPPGLQLGGTPAWAADGGALIVPSREPGERDWTSVTRIEVPGFNARTLLPRRDAVVLSSVVAVRPGTDAFLYATPRPGSSVAGALDIRLHDPVSAASRSILSEASTFRFVEGLTFTGETEVMFAARQVGHGELARQLEALDLHPDSTAIWRMRLGQAPELFFPRAPRSVRGRESWLPFGVAIAWGEALVVTALMSRDRPTVFLSGQTNYELYRIAPDGSPVALGGLRGRIGHLAAARDGSVVVCTLDPDHDGVSDLWVLDMRTGRARPTALLRRVAEDRDFADV
jgi:hypothetical protein